MGGSAEAVCDPELRVRGVAGLRVADASVMPVTPRGNTNAPVIAVAERAADLIRGNTPLSPAATGPAGRGGSAPACWGISPEVGFPSPAASRGALKAATVPAMCDSMAARATSGFRDLMAVLMKSWSWFRFGTELESCWMPPIVVTRKSKRYAVAEEGLWADGTPRTTPAEMAGLIATGQIAVARAGERIVGAVRVQRLDTGEGELGMLVADPAHRGTGVGRELILFAERWSRERGLGAMQLEVLVPRQWSHPSKEFLKAWYTRLGYRPVRTGQVEESCPELAPLLATPCDFVIYHKSLGRPGRGPA